MKTENEMNSSGSKNPAATNGTRKQNFRHKNYRYKAQPKKDGQKFTGQERPVKNTSYKPQLRSQVKPSLKTAQKQHWFQIKDYSAWRSGTDWNEYYSFRV